MTESSTYVPDIADCARVVQDYMAAFEAKEEPRVEDGRIVDIRLMFDTAKFTMPDRQAA